MTDFRDQTLNEALIELPALNAQQKSDLIRGFVTACGLELYDLEAPLGTSGVLRLFVCGVGIKPGAVSLEQCAAISRAILDCPQVEQLMPGQVTLEVSSPGVNRRLRTKEHLDGAVGERIKLKTGKKLAELPDVIVGILQRFDGENLVIASELKGGKIKDRQSEVLTVPFNAIKDCKVCFNFV